MKGKIWVESELGKGSRFHFTAHFRLQIDSVKTVIPRDPMILRDMRVLIVDDNETNCHILVKMLCLARQTCSSRKRSKSDERSEGGVGTGAHLSVDFSRRANAGDGRLCFRGKHQAQPRMGDRYDHDAQLREPAWDARRCRELGVAAYLTKPVRQAELLDAILTALGIKPKKQTRPALITRHSLREDHGHLNILLAEDNAVNQLLAQRMLEKRGHTITVATNGKEALAALREKSLQMVFMDVQMPVMDGFATTEAIRGMEGNHVPIVAMTAHAMLGDKERREAAGMDDYLSKPIFPDELNEVLKRYLPAESKVLKSV